MGLSAKTVRARRKALDVPRMTPGSTKLAIAYAPERLTEEARAAQKLVMGRPEVRAKISASKVGKPLHPNMIAAQREAVKRPKSKAGKKTASARMSAISAHPKNMACPPVFIGPKNRSPCCGPTPIQRSPSAWGSQLTRLRTNAANSALPDSTSDGGPRKSRSWER